MKRVLVTLEPEQLEAADSLAKKEGLSRSELFRRALGNYEKEAARKAELAERGKKIKSFFKLADDLHKKYGRDPDWDPMAILSTWRETGIKK